MIVFCRVNRTTQRRRCRLLLLSADHLEGGFRGFRKPNEAGEEPSLPALSNYTLMTHISEIKKLFYDDSDGDDEDDDKDEDAFLIEIWSESDW